MTARDYIYKSIEQREVVRVKFENFNTPVIHLFFATETKSYRVSQDTFWNAHKIAHLNNFEIIDTDLNTTTFMSRAI